MNKRRLMENTVAILAHENVFILDLMSITRRSLSFHLTIAMLAMEAEWVRD